MQVRKKVFLIWFGILAQGISLTLIISEILVAIYWKGNTPYGWEIREAIEILAIIGLCIGIAIGVFSARQLVARNRKVESQLRVVSGEFKELLQEHFVEWELSKSEADVAYFAVKGLSNCEISELRGTSEGTIKAQLNAVYKKAGVESRTQLLGYFIEELMADPVS